MPSALELMKVNKKNKLKIETGKQLEVMGPIIFFSGQFDAIH
jgi:hypothetical protein